MPRRARTGRAGTQFDIYQTQSGYAAVTSPVRRLILDALATGDKRLPELARAAGRNKSTLSGIHIKHLITQRLIEEVPDGRDARTKHYRLVGRRIGASNVPVDQLRDAVRDYVSLSPVAARIGVLDVMRLLVSPTHAPARIVREQARHLGAHALSRLDASTPAQLLTTLAHVLDGEGVTRTRRIDLAHGALTLEVLAGLDTPDVWPRTSAALTGFLEGAATRLASPRVTPRVLRPARDGTVTITLTRA